MQWLCRADLSLAVWKRLSKPNLSPSEFRFSRIFAVRFLWFVMTAPVSSSWETPTYPWGHLHIFPRWHLAGSPSAQPSVHPFFHANCPIVSLRTISFSGMVLQFRTINITATFSPSEWCRASSSNDGCFWSLCSGSHSLWHLWPLQDTSESWQRRLLPLRCVLFDPSFYFFLNGICVARIEAVSVQNQQASQPNR